MREPTEGWVTVTVRLRPALRQELQDEAYAANTTQQEIVEAALRREPLQNGARVTATAEGVGHAEVPERWLQDGDVIRSGIAEIGEIEKRLDVALDEVALVVGFDAEEDGTGSLGLGAANEVEIDGEILAGHADGGGGVVGEKDVVGAGDFGDADGGGEQGPSPEVSPRAAAVQPEAPQRRSYAGWSRRHVGHRPRPWQTMSCGTSRRRDGVSTGTRLGTGHRGQQGEGQPGEEDCGCACQ